MAAAMRGSTVATVSIAERKAVLAVTSCAVLTGAVLTGVVRADVVVMTCGSSVRREPRRTAGCRPDLAGPQGRSPVVIHLERQSRPVVSLDEPRPTGQEGQV
jgi:hypothetical protein